MYDLRGEHPLIGGISFVNSPIGLFAGSVHLIGLFSSQCVGLLLSPLLNICLTEKKFRQPDIMEKIIQQSPIAVCEIRVLMVRINMSR
ncbi:hypothetical protein AB833_31585 [Chromatiales bacterium (ex Bugula neritina AB1)]|nr:hypothetical protein AB833_31585 [Chromatiales bacterium (ex Bugula neritina AB1)]